MPDAVISALVNAGILGPVLIALGVYVLRRDAAHEKAIAAHEKAHAALQAKLDEAQGKRVDDAQKVAGVLLELNDRWQKLLADSVRTSKDANLTMERIRETLDKVWDRLPRSS
jgi:hypothetical protein